MNIHSSSPHISDRLFRNGESDTGITSAVTRKLLVFVAANHPVRDHIREKSGWKSALELERNPGVRLIAPAATIMAVGGGVQIYSLFRDRGQAVWL